MSQVVKHGRPRPSAGARADAPLIKVEPTRPPRQSTAGFNYRAKASIGTRADYYVPLEHEEEARAALEQAGMKIERVWPRRTMRRRHARVPKRVELALIAEMLGDMWEAGEPPTRILTSLAQSTPNRLVACAFENAAEEVRNGATFSDALAVQTTVSAMPDLKKRTAALASGKKGRLVFPITFSHALRVGEGQGAIADPLTGQKRGAMQLMMERFASDQRRNDAIISAVRGALMYPLAVFIVSVIVIGVMLYVAIPKLKEMFVSMTNDAQLPLPTRILIAVSDFLMSWPGLALGLLLLLAVVGLIVWSKTEKGGDYIARVSIKLPVFGPLLRDMHLASMSRTFGMLASGSGDLKHALRETAGAMTNPAFRDMLLAVLYELEREARTLDVLFRPYTPLVTEQFHTQLVTYHKSGGMDRLMARFAGMLEVKIERNIATFKHVLTTYIIIPLAVFVCGILVSLYMPLFSLAGKMSQSH
jgi:type II secretory pathway component PulF